MIRISGTAGKLPEHNTTLGRTTIMEITEVRGSLDSVRAGAAAAARCQQLLALDDAWTSYLDKRDPDDVVGLEYDLAQLVPLVGEMLSLIGALSEDVVRLREGVEGLSMQDIEQTIARLFAECPTEREQLNARLAALGEWDLRAAIIAAYRYIQSEAPAVMSDTARQIGDLAAGLQTPGDLPKAFRCAIYLALIGAGLVGSIGPHGVITGPALIGAIGNGTLGWDISGCPEILKLLTPHRP
jgi:hypothetical protein